MAHIDEGTVLGGRYEITGRVMASAQQDQVLTGLDQVLNREVLILVASRENASQAAQSARQLATGERTPAPSKSSTSGSPTTAPTWSPPAMPTSKTSWHYSPPATSTSNRFSPSTWAPNSLVKPVRPRPKPSTTTPSTTVNSKKNSPKSQTTPSGPNSSISSLTASTTGSKKTPSLNPGPRVTHPPQALALHQQHKQPLLVLLTHSIAIPLTHRYPTR